MRLELGPSDPKDSELQLRGMKWNGSSEQVYNFMCSYCFLLTANLQLALPFATMSFESSWLKGMHKVFASVKYHNNRTGNKT